jgi:hypothetical protein
MKAQSTFMLACGAGLAALSLMGCGGVEGAGNPTRALHWIVIVDLSASLKKTQLEESRAFVQALAGAARNGDAVTLFRVYERGLTDENFQWDGSIRPAADPAKPRPSDTLALKDFSDELTAVTSVLFDPKIEGALRGTDIFASLFRAGDIAASDPRRKSIIILVSDMLQSTRELNMEKQIPDETWVTSALRVEAIPKLRDVCVGVFGADLMSSQGLKVRDFWKSYFAAAGAELRDENYRNYASSPAQLTCGQT